MASLAFTGLLLAAAAFPLLSGATALGQGLGRRRWVLGQGWMVGVATGWRAAFVRLARRRLVRAP